MINQTPKGIEDLQYGQVLIYTSEPEKMRNLLFTAGENDILINATNISICDCRSDYDIEFVTRRYNFVNMGREAYLTVRMRCATISFVYSAIRVAERFIREMNTIDDPTVGDKVIDVDLGFDLFGSGAGDLAEEYGLLEPEEEPKVEEEESFALSHEFNKPQSYFDNFKLMNACVYDSIPTEPAKAEPDYDAEYKSLMAQISLIVAEYVNREHKDPTELIRNVLKMQKEKIAIAPKTASRLVVNNDFRIILPDYDELELKMTPIQRMFYILFLKYPDGIVLKDLPDHRDELIRIYGIFASDAIRVVNNYMVDDALRNQAICKINIAVRRYVKWADEKTPNPYLITGKRGKAYKIGLSQKKVMVMSPAAKWIGFKQGNGNEE